MLPKSKIDKTDKNYVSIRGYISLLRGVNVGGKNKIIMSELVEAYEKAGFTNVVAYIQSGNVMFETRMTDLSEIKTKIEDLIREQFELDIFVLVRTKEDFQQLSLRNPFLGKSKVTIKNLYVTFLSETPDPQLVTSLQEQSVEGEEWIIKDLEIFAQYHDGYGKAKMTNQAFENKLKVTATTRNWKSVINLHNILGD